VSLPDISLANGQLLVASCAMGMVVTLHLVTGHILHMPLGLQVLVTHGTCIKTSVLHAFWQPVLGEHEELLLHGQLFSFPLP